MTGVRKRRAGERVQRADHGGSRVFSLVVGNVLALYGVQVAYRRQADAGGTVSSRGHRAGQTWHLCLPGASSVSMTGASRALVLAQAEGGGEASSAQARPGCSFQPLAEAGPAEEPQSSRALDLEAPAGALRGAVVPSARSGFAGSIAADGGRRSWSCEFAGGRPWHAAARGQRTGRRACWRARTAGSAGARVRAQAGRVRRAGVT